MAQNSGTGRKARVPSRTGSAAPTAKGGADLSALFGVAAKALAANQGALNQADAQNGNHGDNMVQMFNMLTQVMGEQKGGSPSQQLSNASQYLQQHAT
ncbi:MAG: hypothetical protein U0X92_17685, partial [Anaerolineales bacterium]